MSITLNAEVTLEDFPYKKYFSVDGYYYVIISKAELKKISQSGNYPPEGYWDYNTGMSTDATTNQNWWCVEGEYVGLISGYTYPEAYLCTWYPTGWQLRNGWGSGIYLCLFPAFDDLTSLPSDFPTLDLTTFEDLELQIQQQKEQFNQELNATTATSAEANRMQSVIIEKTEQYENGEIKNYELQNAIDLTSSYLDELSQSSTNTIADKIAINNAQNSVLLAQEKLNVNRIDGRLSQILKEYQDQHKVSDLLRENIEIINSLDELQMFIDSTTEYVLTQLENNTMTKPEAILQFSEVSEMITYISTLEGLTERDIEILKLLSNNVNVAMKTVDNFGDINKSVSEKSQASDEEEIELLNQMVSVMQEQTVENKLQDQQIAGSAGNINSILDPVWNNKFFTYLIGTSGVLIIACILLHTRYRML